MQCLAHYEFICFLFPCYTTCLIIMQFFLRTNSQALPTSPNINAVITPQFFSGNTIRTTRKKKNIYIYGMKQKETLDGVSI